MVSGRKKTLTDTKIALKLILKHNNYRHNLCIQEVRTERRDNSRSDLAQKLLN